MINTNRIQKCLFTAATMFTATFLPLSAIADFEIISRNSELIIDSTNLGGVEFTIDSTDLSDPFSAHTQNSVTHEEASGNLNGGTWNGLQESSVSSTLIRAEMQSEVLTQQLLGAGIPILNLRNEFEVVFEVDETTEIELGGTLFGTASGVGANDFVRIRFQENNGVVFLNMFATSSLDDLNSVFTATLQPGIQYRLLVESHADAIGAQASESSLSVCLRPRFSTGDVNQDGMVNLLDVDPFVAAITDGNYQGQADTNCDGLVDLTDVAPFIALLNGN